MGMILSEPAIVPDEVIHGVAYVDEIEPGTYRVTYYKKQRNAYDGESHDLVLAARHVLSGAVGLEIAKAILRATGVQCCGGERLRKLAH